METTDRQNVSANAEKIDTTGNGSGVDDRRLVRALRSLEKDWPAGYMLFSFNSTLCLYRGHPCDGGEEVAIFDIPTDGGDPS